MATIFYNNPELVIGLHTKVIFVNPNDLQTFKEIVIPDDLVKHGLPLPEAEATTTTATVTVTEPAAEGQASADAPVPRQLPPLLEPIIQNVQLSPDRTLLAVSTSSQKGVLLYECRPEHARLASVRPLARTSSAMRFSSDSEQLLVTDKTGDCYLYDCVNMESPPRLLFGHLSVVYDVLWTADKKYIITCDRDDKIRVTNYPDTYDIHGYCLGHKEFVASMSLLEGELLASVSGDRTLRLWSFQVGRELAKIVLPAPGINMDTRRLDASTYEAAVLMHQTPQQIGIYRITKSALGDWEITQVQLHQFDALTIAKLCYASERLYVVGNADGVEKLELQVAPIADAPAPPDHWLEMVQEQFGDVVWRIADVSTWFKKRYDNVSDYLERKRRRIEAKQK